MGEGEVSLLLPKHGFDLTFWKTNDKDDIENFLALQKYIFVHCLLFLSLFYMKKLQVKNTNTGSR